MDRKKITTALLSNINDELAVTEYGHGHLVTMPLSFYDEDRITLFVEPYEHGVRVTDHGTTAMRLQMADVNIDSPRVVEAWRRSTAPLGGHSLAAEEGVVAAWGSEDEVGRLLLAVAESVLRVDQLRWLWAEGQRIPFKEKVVNKIIEVTGEAEEVTPNAPLAQTSGRSRQVTAAIGSNPDTRIYVQAVGSSSGERAEEHCYYIFDHSELPRERILAVVAGRLEQWADVLVEELTKVTDVAFFDESNQVGTALLSRLSTVR